MTSYESNKPQHWFRTIQEGVSLPKDPQEIEYLKMWTGETFIHKNGTAYYNGEGLDHDDLTREGVTHYRIITP
jgi:hypothetical protein